MEFVWFFRFFFLHFVLNYPIIDAQWCLFNCYRHFHLVAFASTSHSLVKHVQNYKTLTIPHSRELLPNGGREISPTRKCFPGDWEGFSWCMENPCTGIFPWGSLPLHPKEPSRVEEGLILKLIIVLFFPSKIIVLFYENILRMKTSIQKPVLPSKNELKKTIENLNPWNRQFFSRSCCNVLAWY